MKVFHCDHCGHLLFFENVECLRCKHKLGYMPDLEVVGSLDPAGDGVWKSPLPRARGRLYRPCKNYDEQNTCNWMLPAGDTNLYCRSCRLTRIIPDLSVPGNWDGWYRLEVAKRRLVFSLLSLNLPLANRIEEPQTGLAFEFKADPLDPHAPRVMTGHDDGVITLNLIETDDGERERRRVQLHEPYRTLLGHFRHEVGHYYWDRLIKNTHWIGAYRASFGDEREDYGEALKKHYKDGPPADWQERFISAYASTHPWEDWAETWAHYLHMVDTVEIALACGLSLRPQREDEPSLRPDSVPATKPPSFEQTMERWFALTYLLNNLNRGLGLGDGYPFVLSASVVAKLRFVHQVVAAAAEKTVTPGVPQVVNVPANK